MRGTALSLHEAEVVEFLPGDRSFDWPRAYKYWANPRVLNIYATVLPCMGQAADFGEAGGPETCVVGTMMLQVLPPDNSFGDLAKFLIGWLLLPTPSGNPGDYDNQPITLGTVLDFQTQMKDSDFWKGFPDAALVVTKNQFVPTLKTLQQNQDEPLAVIPPWPGSSFSYVPGGAPPVTGKPLKVMEGNSPMDGDNAAFVEYCHHLIVGALSEIGLFIQSAPGESRYDRAKSMKWSEIWNQMFAQL
jgi:hypothetical protein